MSEITVKPTLVVSDMQRLFRASRKVLTQVEQELIQAIQNDWPIVLLKFKHMGPLHPCLLNLLAQTPSSSRVRYVERWKDRADGSAVVANACQTDLFGTERFRVMGILTCTCVMQTMLGLSLLFPKAHLDVVTYACATNRENDWTTYPRLPNLNFIT